MTLMFNTEREAVEWASARAKMYACPMFVLWSTDGFRVSFDNYPAFNEWSVCGVQANGTTYPVQQRSPT